MTWRLAELLVCLHITLQAIANGQPVYLSIESRVITANNSEIKIEDLGEGFIRPTLNCHTDLAECCRGVDTGSVGIGEWYYPDGRVLQRNADALASGEDLYRVRNAPQVVRLATRENVHPLSPTGSYCCVIPTTEGEMTFCTNLVVCLSLPSPANGIISYTDPTLGVNTIATLRCNPGFFSSSSRTCQSDGTWSGFSLFCSGACFDLETPTNGDISYNLGVTDGRQFGTLATYSCDGTVRTCQTGRVWSGAVPECAFPICLDLPQLLNGNIVYSNGSKNNRSFPSMATYSCEIGYVLNGDETRKCQSDESWSGSEPICDEITCDDLSIHTNGEIIYSAGLIDNRPINSTAMYSCLSGYTLVGDESRTCQLNRTWSNDSATCVETTCAELNTPVNGSISYYSESMNAESPVYTVATYSCDAGYTLNGDVNRTCELSGLWSGSASYCTETTCVDLDVPTDGRITYSFGITDSRPISTTASYSCVVGYTLYGESNRTCQISGNWSGSTPFCNVTTCEELDALVNGQIVYSSGSADYRPFSTVATYGCSAGYTLSEDINRTCGHDGSWSGSSPRCEETTCSYLTAPSNGAVLYSNGTRPIGTVAFYSCDSGYILQGDSNSTCQEDGTWRNSLVQCQAVSCGPLKSPSDGVVNLTSITFMGVATYECDYGYILSGSVARVCEEEGQWRPSAPTCEPDYGSLLNQKVTAENYAGIASLVSSFADASVNNTDLQTRETLSLMSGVFGNMAELISSTSNITVDPMAVEGMVSTLNNLLQWKPGTLAVESTSSMVNSQETVVSRLAQQRNLSLAFSDITLIAEMAKTDTFREIGDIANFSSTKDISASISLPGELFEQVSSDQGNIGLFYALYEDPSLFPVTESQRPLNSTRETIVATPVIAATVGEDMDFNRIDPPVVIELELEEQNENHTIGLVRCASWDFSKKSWVTDGCKTILKGDTVLCECTHLTNFAVLIDICSRTQDCVTNVVTDKVLSVITYVGVILSCVGLFVTVLTLLVFKELRERDNAKHNIQLCIAIFCVLVVFAAGIEQTEPYGGCVVVSVLIHYFSLAAVMWMGAEAVLMFQKLVIIFGEITSSYLILVSLICWLVPLVPVLITMIIDMANGFTPESDLIVTRNVHNSTHEITGGFCFLKHPGVFFGAFLAPIIAVLVFNLIIFFWVSVIVLRSTKGKLERANEKLKPKKAIRIIISLLGVMCLFGLTWLFAAFTFTIDGNDIVRIIFQALFVVCAAFQGVFFFIFFCVLDKKAREAWRQLLCKTPKSGAYSVNSSNSGYQYNSRGKKNGSITRQNSTNSTGLKSPSTPSSPDRPVDLESTSGKG